MLDEEEVHCILARFKTKMMDMLSPTTTSEFHVKLENLHSLSGILLCIITNVVRDCFRVTLEAGNCNYGDPDPAYISFLSNGERRLHIFLWTKDKEYRNIDVYGHCGEGIECGLIVMVDEGEDVLEVCKEIITAFA